MRPLLIAFGGALVVAAVGGALSPIDGWYRGLEKSALNPPDWVFGPAWTIIYALTALAAARGWGHAAKSDRAALIALFALNGILNVSWSALFFTLRRPDWALVEVVALWLSVLSLMVFLALKARGALLLAPYLIWVAFAAWLNFRLVQLNPAFG